MKPERLAACLLAPVLLACGSSTPAPAGPEPLPGATPVASASTPEPSAATPESTAAASPAPADSSCGPLACRLFDSPEQALAQVLESKPLVLAIGEAHAQKGTEAIPSATRRFTEALLPALGGKASDLILELWAPDPKCMKKAKAVAERQKPVTEPQAETNQNEYLVLGQQSRKNRIVPHLLQPSCADYDQITAAGAGDIQVMLETIARLTAVKSKPMVDRNRSAGHGPPKMVVLYGGALHNDVAPREGREKFSFGPELTAHTGGSYVELDLIVPEFIKDSEAWKALAWYPHFDPKRAPAKTTLYNPAPHSYVMIFARSGIEEPSR